MHEFCTHFDSNYLARGLALYHSLRAHCPAFRLWALCTDEAAYDAVVRLDLPNVQAIALTTMEQHDLELTKAKTNRSLIEYYFTCTPCLPLFVFARAPEISRLTYLDADLYFFSDPAPIFDEIGDQSIAIVEHRFPPGLKRFEAAGRYNVGWLSFRRDDEGLQCLRVWREQCLEWCHDYSDNGRYGDQKYLDDWPQRYQHVVTLQHKGINVAPWNLANYDVSMRDGRVWIDDQPLLFFHFHGLSALRRHVYDSRLSGYGVAPSRVVARDIYGRYIAAVEQIAAALPASPALAGARRGAAAAGASDEPSSRWRQRTAAVVSQMRLWKNTLAGRYLVIWNGLVITSGR